MKLGVKKIIAREFLILVICIAIAFLTYLSISTSNFYQRSQITKLTKSIHVNSRKSDSLQNTYKSKSERHTWLHNKVMEEFSDAELYPQLSKQPLWSRLAEISKRDSIGQKWVSIWSTGSNSWKSFFNRIGFENPTQLKYFIDFFSFNETDSTNHRNVEMLLNTINVQKREKIEIEAKLYSYEEQNNIILKSVAIAFVIFFLIRYFIYALMWSIKMLKSTLDSIN